MFSWAKIRDEPSKPDAHFAVILHSFRHIQSNTLNLSFAWSCELLHGLTKSLFFFMGFLVYLFVFCKPRVAKQLHGTKTLFCSVSTKQQQTCCNLPPTGSRKEVMSRSYTQDVKQKRYFQTTLVLKSAAITLNRDLVVFSSIRCKIKKQIFKTFHIMCLGNLNQYSI